MLQIVLPTESRDRAVDPFDRVFLEGGDCPLFQFVYRVDVTRKFNWAHADV